MIPSYDQRAPDKPEAGNAATGAPSPEGLTSGNRTSQLVAANGTDWTLKI
jgi:hypothetical protein